MRRTPFAGVIVLTAATLAAPAFARDDGPRFARDRLDALVAEHQEANRYIAQTGEKQTQEARSKAERGAS
jgi:hypothetical protein